MKPEPRPHAAQVQLVRASWRLLEPQRERLGALFYERLFVLQPDLKPMFKGDIQAQASKLMATLNVMVNLLDDLSPLQATLMELGQRHRELQVRPEHYRTAAQALDQMLMAALGAQASDALREAWQEAYWAVARPMLGDGDSTRTRAV